MTPADAGGLQLLVESCAPYWAAEAEVCRTYFESPARKRRSDLVWIARQAHKELSDGVIPLLRRGHTQQAMEELSHCRLFAELHRALRPPQDPPLEIGDLGTRWRWAENDELARIRAGHREVHGDLGARVEAFTEGGGGTLYAEGARLRGRGGADDLIAEVCARVHEDEIGHMRLPATSDDSHGCAVNWSTFTRLTVEQLEQRIRMRNAQFGGPVPPERLAELLAGHADPLPSDYPGIGGLAGSRLETASRNSAIESR